MNAIYYVLGIVLLIASSYGIGHHEGYKMREAEDEAVIFQKNQEMNEAREKADAQLNQAKTQLASKGKQLTDAIRSGQQRLFVPIANPSGCTPSSSGDTETRAELDKSIAEALIKITLDGDKSIVYLNSCIDRYNEIKAISGKR